MQILLIAPPYSPFTPKESAVPPLGLARLATIARRAGDVSVCDMGAHEAAGEDGWKDLLVHLETGSPDIVGIGPVVTSNRTKTARIARLVRQRCPEATIVVGGPDPTFTHAQMLSAEPAIDVAFIGEAEASFDAFLPVHDQPRRWQSVAGIAYRDGERVATSQPRLLTREELDALPLPSWDLFPLEIYRDIARRAGSEPYLPIETSRGCALNCTFCACSALFAKKFRNRSPASVLHEMKSVRASYGVRRFSLNDDNPSINVSHVLALARTLADDTAEPFELTFSATVDCSIFRNDEQMSLMRKAGFLEVFMGCEAVTPSVIAATRKTRRPELWAGQIAEAIASARRAGIASRTSWILGLPNETRDSFLATIEFIREHQPDTALLSLLQPYPGTEMAKLADDPDNPYGLRWVSANPSAMIASKFDPVVETKDLARAELVDLAFTFLTELSPLLEANVSGSPYYLFELWRDRNAVGSP